MFKQVSIGLFALFATSVVVILGTEDIAHGGCTYWGRVGGSLTCLVYSPGSVIVDASIDCVNPLECDISAPIKIEVELFGNVGGGCNFNPNCSMAGTLVCDGVEYERTLTSSDVHFPLTAKANLNCKRGSCAETFEIEIKKCNGKAANCCFGPNCCPQKTKKVSFIPDAFDARANLSQPRGQVEPGTPQTLTISDANCTDYYDHGAYSCFCKHCDCQNPEDEACFPFPEDECGYGYKAHACRR